MKANELRIGNIVERYTDVFGRGWSWTNTSHEDIYSIACGHEDKYRPIPLTEEWLLKFGFRPLDNKNWHLGKIKVWSGATGIYFQFNTPDDIDDVEIKYVHQIQNLYFALTGEELMLNS